MTSRMRVAGPIVAAGALLALPLLCTTPASARHHHHHHATDAGSKPSSAAYPKAPGGTPAADDNGKPVSPKSDAGAKPDPASKAGTEKAPSATGTPATAYPGAPTDQPAANPKP